jgi:RNA polymerase sigma factor (sigma-70 family)
MLEHNRKHGRRKQQRVVQLSALHFEPESKGCEACSFPEEDRGLLEAVLLSLSPTDQQVVRHSFGLGEEELPPKEIGERVGICRQAVESRRTRILERLRSDPLLLSIRL